MVIFCSNKRTLIRRKKTFEMWYVIFAFDFLVQDVTLFLLLLQLAVEPTNRDALDALDKLYPARDNMKYIDLLVHNGDHVGAVYEISQIIEICPWSSNLRERRAESYLALGDYMSAISDIRSTTKLLSDNTEGYFKLSTWLYRLGQVEEALK